MNRVLAGIVEMCLLCGGCPGMGQTTDWPVYNGGPDGDHCSRLTQINRGNVKKLQVAWSFDTGEKGGIQTNPLVVGRTLFAYTPTQKVVALDAATGTLKWKFDAGINGTQPARGVAYWTDGKDGRILAGVMNYLYCLNAETGKPIATFGEGGRIDLRREDDPAGGRRRDVRRGVAIRHIDDGAFHEDGTARRGAETADVGDASGVRQRRG